MKQKSFWKRPVWFLSLLALVMIVTHTVGSSMAYFTTYATAQGGHAIWYSRSYAEIHEDFDDWVKSISVENTGDVPCYIRVRVMAGEQFGLTFSDENGKWTKGENDDYWYYSDIVPVGGVTEILKASISLPEDLAQDFNVIVIQESVPVSYLSDGQPHADWSLGKEGA